MWHLRTDRYPSGTKFPQSAKPCAAVGRDYFVLSDRQSLSRSRKRVPMNTKSLKRYMTLAIVSLFVMGCSNGSSKSESDQIPSTAVVIEQTQVSTVSDSQLAAVENDLASLDADLEVIDQAIADLDSVAP